MEPLSEASAQALQTRPGETPEVALAPEHFLDAPSVGGDSTSVSYLQLKGERVFVGYTTPGGPFGGGVDALMATDPEDTDAGQSFVSDYIDVVSVTTSAAGRLYVGGALSPNNPFEKVSPGSPAVLAQTRLADVEGASSLVDLASGAVMDVAAAEGEGAYAVTGDDGAFYALTPGLEITRETAMADLRSVATAGDALYLLDGDGVVHRAEGKDAPFEVLADAGDGIGYRSIAKLRQHESRLYVALNNGGFAVLDAESGEEIARHEAGYYTSVATDGRYVYAANANKNVGGVSIFKWTDEGTLKELRDKALGGLQANYVAVAGQHLYVASGYGGVYVVDIQKNTPPPA